MALIQMRPDVPEEYRVVEWIAFASNAFNVLAPFYTNVSATPDYLANTTKKISTDNCYWSSRMIAAMADASYSKSVFHIERYQLAVQSRISFYQAYITALIPCDKDSQIHCVFDMK